MRISEQDGSTIDVYLQSGSSGWALGTSNPPAAGIEDIVIPKGTQSAQIVFHLLSNGGIGFDTSDPIWVKMGNACPKNSGIAQQIELVSCNATTLTVADDNRGNACNLGYQLNFTGADPLDPIIKNGGTGA